jgi:hypothetical protein
MQSVSKENYLQLEILGSCNILGIRTATLGIHTATGIMAPVPTANSPVSSG